MLSRGFKHYLTNVPGFKLSSQQVVQTGRLGSPCTAIAYASPANLYISVLVL